MCVFKDFFVYLKSRVSDRKQRQVCGVGAQPPVLWFNAPRHHPNYPATPTVPSTGPCASDGPALPTPSICHTLSTLCPSCATIPQVAKPLFSKAPVIHCSLCEVCAARWPSPSCGKNSQHGLRLVLCPCRTCERSGQLWAESLLVTVAERGKKLFHPLVHSPDSCSSQQGANPKPGASSRSPTLGPGSTGVRAGCPHHRRPGEAGPVCPQESTSPAVG